MSDFIAAAQTELAAVEAELAASPLFQKYERLRELVALYSDGEAASGNSSKPATSFARVTEPKRINRAPSPERDRAIELAAEAIRGRYTPTKTSEIFDVIVQQGAQIAGKSPKGNLSAMLYHSPLFRSHGRQGWTLAEHDDMIDLLGTGEERSDDIPDEALESDDHAGL